MGLIPGPTVGVINEQPDSPLRGSSWTPLDKGFAVHVVVILLSHALTLWSDNVLFHLTTPGLTIMFIVSRCTACALTLGKSKTLKQALDMKTIFV